MKMKAVAQPKLKERTLAPQFDLAATGGRRLMTWKYKGLNNLVIVFLPDLSTEESRDELQEFARRYGQYREHNTELIIVSQDNIQTLDRISRELSLPFPLACDVDGAVTDSYTTLTPALFVLDRFGELHAQSEAEADEDFPDYRQIIDWLHLIELECPECGVPTWEP
jgi:peroxiredoxin